MKKYVGTGMVLVIFLVFSVSPGLAEVDITGTWKGETMVPDSMDPDVLTLVIQKKDGAYQAMISDEFGYCENAEASDLEVDGNTLSFNFMIMDGGTIFITMTVDGDRMTGTWEDEGGSGADVTMTRQK